MANRTVKDAHSVKGTNPQYLVEKIIRTRIYECRYWKEECFALTAALLVDKAMELKYIGGIFGGNIKPTPFLCLILKMLQIQPEKDIVVEFIRNEDFKYVRALGAVYMRLVGTSLDCYKYLEPLYYDYRKMRRMNRNGEFEVLHMDEFIDELLREERICDIILPRVQKRQVLEENNQLESRVSAVEEDLEDMETDDEEELVRDSRRSPTPEKSQRHRDADKITRSPSPRIRRSRSRSPHRRDREERRHDRDKDRKRHRSPGKKHREEDDRRHKSKKSKKDRKDDDHRSHKHRHEKDGRHHHKDRRDRDEKDRRGREDPDVREANELRARLGMVPLRP
ncbi:pre-mRNA-splicing factor 38A-like [Gigantopelta aegis]|uniref:pre-mRNA-splicing factor 38A-like n=1 Tax=Gigantopelta aegis TaxID=1735272 RepID=UPI001B88AE9C|nr:pre-mRNA-splicing factor 38A-like [Gigantopelta aegis]